MNTMLRILAIGASIASAFLYTVPHRPARLKAVADPDRGRNSESNEDDTKLIESLFDKGNKKSETSYNDEQILLDEKRADIHLPTTGVSVSETMEEADKDQFKVELVPVNTLPGVAQIVTKSSKGSFDPIRYLVALSPYSTPTQTATSSATNVLDKADPNSEQHHFVMTDVPPYSDRLAALIRKFMGPSGTLVAILMTSRTGVHYDEGPSVFTTRISPLRDWVAVFPKLKVVAYRLDIPRDCNAFVSQRINGYGPWAWDDQKLIFEETGKPLITKQWDVSTIKTMLQRGIVPPINDETNDSGEANKDEDDDDHYTLESIRAREEGKRLLAVYTPGHTHGTISYVFPKMNVVVSGFTIPIEDSGDVNEGQSVAPIMDARGYITTSAAGMAKQMESARHLVQNYGDRFGIILPARDDPFFLDELDASERKETLLRIIDQYDKIGQVYSQLGIFADGENEF